MASEDAPPFLVELTKTSLGFGLQLDVKNVVTVIKPGTQAEAVAASGGLAVGDKVLSLNGIEVSFERPVSQVAAELNLAEGQAAIFQLRRCGSGAPPPPPPPMPPQPPPQLPTVS